VPNQTKTPLHSFRVDDELWLQTLAAAHANGQTIADVLRAAMRSYLEEQQAKAPERPTTPTTATSSHTESTR
jgi:hypothetical protein